MNRKGFTLIELLAVILILGIIALIAMPVVTNVIDDAKINSIKVSSLNYVKAVQDHLVEYRIKNGNVPDGVYNLDDIKKLLKKDKIISNDPLIKSKVTISDNKIVDYTIYEDKYVIYKDNEETVIDIYDALACQRQTGTNGTYNYGDLFVCDLGDGVERNFYVYDYSEDDRITFIADRSYVRANSYQDAEKKAQSFVKDWPKAISSDLPKSEHIGRNIMGNPNFQKGWTINWNEQPHDSNGYSIWYWLYDYVNECAGCKIPGDGTEMGNQYVLDDMGGGWVIHIGKWNMYNAGFWRDTVRPVVTVSKREING